MRVAQIERGRIQPNPDQPRKKFHQEALEELADSIREQGLLQPIIVRPRDDGYQIVAGERRFRAITMLGWDEIPCVILDDLSDEATFILATTENVARRDMNLIEEANAYAQIMNLGKTLEEVAKLFGKSPQYIQYRLNLLKLREDIQQLVATGQMSQPMAGCLARLSHDNQGVVLAKLARGELKDDENCAQYIYALEKREAQPVLLGPLFGQPFDEEAAERRRRTKRELDNVFDKINRLAAAYESLLEMEPDEIAAAYGALVLAGRDRMQQLFVLASRAKVHMKAAAASYMLTQETERRAG